MVVSRRAFCAGLAALSAQPLTAGEPIDLAWADLLPEGTVALPPDLQALMGHDPAAPARRQPLSSGLRGDWNGRTVRLSGFVVPLDYDGTGLRAFMLVPYVGACIHVPPPPANQLVLVTTDRPYEDAGMFRPVTVTGQFGSSMITTELAQVGYALSAQSIVPFEG